MKLTSNISDYDIRWPGKFDLERKLIEEKLDSLIDEVHHVGSTSVPNMVAKPEIDILIIVHSLKNIPTISSGMAELGYDVRGECEMPGRFYFSKNINNIRTHKAHICTHAHHLPKELIVFRNYLRDHRECAQSYGELKFELARSNQTGIREYLDGKEGFIRNTIKTAELAGYDL